MVCPGVDPYWSESFTITKCAQKEYIGKTVYELACARAPFKRTKAIYREALEVLYDILEADPEAICAFTKDKREFGSIAYYLRSPVGMPCTDSHGSPANMPEKYDRDNPGRSPSTYCMFPNYLVKTVREGKIMDLPEAIRKATSLPASIIGIEDRGLLKEGFFADIQILDWENLCVHHDFLHPNKGADGIRFVFVNGQIACEDKAIMNTRAGRVLRKGKS
jgi:N-acyl-D-aspartate/D-glutamate deacylase